ncbi:MAG: hypothetical protein AAGB31_06215 [Bdellovibrio sp.]
MKKSILSLTIFALTGTSYAQSSSSRTDAERELGTGTTSSSPATTMPTNPRSHYPGDYSQPSTTDSRPTTRPQDPRSRANSRDRSAEPTTTPDMRGINPNNPGNPASEPTSTY